MEKHKALLYIIMVLLTISDKLVMDGNTVVGIRAVNGPGHVRFVSSQGNKLVNLMYEKAYLFYS